MLILRIKEAQILWKKNIWRPTIWFYLLFSQNVSCFHQAFVRSHKTKLSGVVF